MGRSVALGLAAALLASCAPTPVEVDLTFPSRETFLYSDFGRLLVYEVELDAPDQSCPALLNEVAADRFGAPVFDSDWTPVCDFREGGIALDDVPPGPHAYVVLTRDDSNNRLLAGCRVGEAYEGAPAVSVALFPTPTYHDATTGRTLTCTNEDDKCRGGC